MKKILLLVLLALFLRRKPAPVQAPAQTPEPPPPAAPPPVQAPAQTGGRLLVVTNRAAVVGFRYAGLTFVDAGQGRDWQRRRYGSAIAAADSAAADLALRQGKDLDADAAAFEASTTAIDRVVSHLVYLDAETADHLLRFLTWAGNQGTRLVSSAQRLAASSITAGLPGDALVRA